MIYLIEVFANLKINTKFNLFDLSIKIQEGIDLNQKYLPLSFFIDNKECIYGKVYNGMSNNSPKELILSLNCGTFEYHTSKKKNGKPKLSLVKKNIEKLCTVIKEKQPKFVFLQEFFDIEFAFQELTKLGYSMIYIPTIFFENGKTAGICTLYFGELNELSFKFINHSHSSLPNIGKSMSKFGILSYVYNTLIISHDGVEYINIHNTAFGNETDRFITIRDLLCVTKGKNYIIGGDWNLYGVNARPNIVPRKLKFLPNLIVTIFNKLILKKPFSNWLNKNEIKLMITKCGKLDNLIRFYFPNKPTFTHSMKLIQVSWLLDFFTSNFFHLSNLDLIILDGFDHKIVLANLEPRQN